MLINEIAEVWVALGNSRVKSMKLNKIFLCIIDKIMYISLCLGRLIEKAVLSWLTPHLSSSFHLCFATTSSVSTSEN